MTKRSMWCEFDKDTRKYIKKRDNDRCIICGNKGALQIMHVFLSRAHGGKGSKENGCLGCVNCHKIIDNPIGTTQNELSKKYLQRCKDYLIEKENLWSTYKSEKELKESLKYKKEIVKIELEIPIKKEHYKRCKDCQMLVKNKNNSSIPTYYCKYKKIRLNKSTKACNNFKEKETKCF